MEFSDFIAHRTSSRVPDTIHPLLKALLLESLGDWDRAHSIAQEDSSNDGSWVHAYLHRVEGDQWNANYWYSRAGRSMPAMTLSEEWESIGAELCSRL